MKTSLLKLPQSPFRFRLEEINMPESMVQQLTGQTVTVTALPEEMPCTRKVSDFRDSPSLIAPDGTVWNDYRPQRLIFKDREGRKWNIPRHWRLGPRAFRPSAVEPAAEVFQECEFTETVHLPSAWDLMDINIPPGEAHQAGGKPTQVMVHLKPGEQAKVYWRDSAGDIWRIPHDWRRRRIRLPSFDVLVAQEIPADVAESFAQTVVSVNYHPGSLCCLRDGYRFRDACQHRWPVRKRDCIVLGYGSEREVLA